jgi:hypothetical protein
MKINENYTAPLNDLFNKIQGLEREDYASPANGARIFNNSISIGLDANRHEFSLTEHAHGQVASRWAGLDTFRRHAEGTNLQPVYERTVNDALALDDRKVMIRTINDEGTRIARAVVSDKFKPIDDDVLVPEVLDVIGDHGDKWRSLGGQVTDTNTFIRFIERTPSFKFGKREVHVGFQYSNSEVGAGSTKFSLFFFDSFCENGCVFGKMVLQDVKWIHRGSAITTDFGRIFEDRMKQAEVINVRNAIREASQLVATGRHDEAVRGYLEAAWSREIPSDVSASDFLKTIGGKVDLTKTEQEDMLVHYDGTNNQYGVQAAITRLAQDAPTFSDRVRLETAGGKVMSMSTREWNSIAALS